MDQEEYVEAVLSFVEQVPSGRVTTYGALAEAVGAGGPRQVGSVMSRYGGPVPWWRVVRADGTPPLCHDGVAHEHHLAEATPLRSSGKVDMAAAFWEPTDAVRSVCAGPQPPGRRDPAQTRRPRAELPTAVHAEGLVLRQWAADDIPAMVRLFDTAEMDRRTPLAHPFGEEAAAAYVERARRGRASGTLQLAITEAGDVPLGEVLLFPTDDPKTCELAYAVGADHRGSNLGSRAVLVLLPAARALGYDRATLKIEAGNPASERVAEAAGFIRTDRPWERRERKGYSLQIATWARFVP